MNLVFLNSFEKKVEEDRVTTAQVSISEHHGEWKILWNELREDGSPNQESWFTGTKWQDMLQCFRSRLQSKRSEGYVALVELSEDTGTPGMKARATQMLHYYSERHEKPELFQELRKWRNEQAAKEGKSPFILASNRMLRMISAFLPQSVEELQQIPGFGEYKVGLYGDAILRLTRGYERSHGFPLDWVAEQVDPVAFEDWLKQQKDLRWKLEAEKRETKRKLLEGISGALDLAALQEQLQLPRRELLVRIEELDKEGYDVGPLVELELNRIEPERREKAWSLFEKEGDRFLKPVLQKLYDDSSLEERQLEHAYEWLRLLRIRFRKAKGEGSRLTEPLAGQSA